MAANQAIIEAAAKAYAFHETDMSGSIKMMAEVSKQITGIVNKAIEKTKQIDTDFNVLQGLENKALINLAVQKRNDPTLTQAEKIKWFQDIKKSADLLEEWSIDVNGIFKDNGKEISGAMDEAELTWLASVRSGEYFEGTYNIDINDNGTIDDSEKNLQPLKIENDKLLILDKQGNYIDVNKLRSSKEFAKNSDSEKFYNLVAAVRDDKGQGNKFEGTTHVELDEYLQTKRLDYENTVNTKEINSMAYDKKLNVNGENVYFYEHYVNEYAITEADASIKQHLEAYQNDQVYTVDSEGRNPGDDGYIITLEFMTKEEKERMGKILFKQIAAAENIDLKTEVLDWVQMSLRSSMIKKHQLSIIDPQ